MSVSHNSNNNPFDDININDNDNNESVTMTSSRNEKILWSCIGRIDNCVSNSSRQKVKPEDTTILAEAGEDYFDGAVALTARGILSCPVTPGYEYYNLRNGSKLTVANNKNTKLKAIKFHLHDHSEPANKKVWVFAAVYQQQKLQNKQQRTFRNMSGSSNNQHAGLQLQVQLFLEKIVGLTELYRDEDDAWRFGSTLACQATFAPILLQRMQEVTYRGQLAQISNKLEQTQKIMNQNITNLLQDLEPKLQALEEESSQLQQMAQVFKKNTKRVRRAQMMQDAKHGVVLGTVVTAGLALCIVPPLIIML